MEGKRLLADDVDVSLHELAKTPVLRPFPAPNLLCLVALERKVELSRVFQNVPGKRNRQVEMKAHLRILGRPALQAAQDVDLLGGLSLAQQLVERLDRAGLDPRKTMQLEGAAQSVENAVFDDPVLRQPLGESGERGNLHGDYCSTIGAHPRHPGESPERKGADSVQFQAISPEIASFR